MAKHTDKQKTARRAKYTKSQKTSCACGAKTSKRCICGEAPKKTQADDGTRCTCGEAYTQKDLDWGRCLSCGRMICAKMPKDVLVCAAHGSVCDCDGQTPRLQVPTQKVRPAECIEPDQRKEFAAEFPEPTTCLKCGTDEPLYISMASVNDEDLMVWICDACGYAHVPPRKKAWSLSPEQEVTLKNLEADMALLIENESHLDEARNLAGKVIKETLLRFRPDMFD